MNRVVRFTSIIVIILASIASIVFQPIQLASTMPTSVTQPSTSVNIAQKIDFRRHFQALGVNGSIMIYDTSNDRVFEYNPQRNKTAFLPASTFKILNSLIALETGVIADEVAVLTWDGINRPLVPGWNRDLNMREAMKLSAVWFYQVLARRVGHDRMQQWVSKVGYGNQKIGGKNDIDKFWLEGELRITTQQQIQFLRRLYKNDLPFSARSISIVKDILTVEKTPDYSIRAKTGWDGSIAWYVGYLERGKNAYFFATNLDLPNQKNLPTRIELTRRCLKDLSAL